MMPNLSYHFHLSPADIWNLSVDELAAYVRALEQLKAG